MGANVFSRLQTQHDANQILLAAQALAVRLSPTVADARDRSGFPLLRKRSLVQIQYGPRHFSKTCLTPKASMGASHLRFYSLIAGQSALTLQCE